MLTKILISFPALQVAVFLDVYLQTCKDADIRAVLTLHCEKGSLLKKRH